MLAVARGHSSSLTARAACSRRAIRAICHGTPAATNG
jgi:hypothetical protein